LSVDDLLSLINVHPTSEFFDRGLTLQTAFLASPAQETTLKTHK